MSLSTGTRLGHYEILAPIGAGSMGQVYRACDLRLNREVAIKVLPPGAGSDLERQARFAKEAQAAASIKHPNVAVIYDSDRCDGVTYIAMELVEGEQLSDVLARGQPTPDRALAIALAVARGLAAAHERGVLHRDLKPANIVLTPEGFPKIVDFGLAKVMTEPSDLPRDLPTVTSNDTRAGVILGTANYMSPEQARGQRVDARSDMFSFGIVLHELLTGSRPFIGPSAPEVLAAIISKPHPRLPLLAGRATVTDLQRIVDRCLEKSPAARYPTMIGVVGDLENACRPAAAISRSSRSMWLLAAAVLLAMAALFGWWTLRTGRDETQWVLESGLPELERLVAADAYAEAFALAARIDRARPDDATLRELWPKLAQVLTVSTTPDGAEVRFRSVSAADGPWESLGVSPLVERRVPIGFFWLRVEKAGFDTFEALIGGQGVYIDPSRPRTIAIELEPVGGQPSRSVHVPGGRTAINLGRLDVVDPVQLPPFRIDRFEVTNREYKTFLESGAYRDPARWHHEFRDGGRHLTFDEAVSRLVDQTGRPGPSTWEVGTFADGNTDQPVSGVSWYEAAAYCESVGKALPTIFHWSAAALPGSTAVAVVPGSNFGERGLRPVGSGRPGLHGAYDMAGNAKEWTWNDAGGTRYILGGAWNEPGYQFHQPDAQAPLTRRAGFGFRCAEYSDVMPEVMVAARRAVPLPAPMASRDPIPDDVFRAYKALFAFDRVPMDARLLERDTSNPAWSRERWRSARHTARKTSSSTSSCPSACVHRFSPSCTSLARPLSASGRRKSCRRG